MSSRGRILIGARGIHQKHSKTNKNMYAEQTSLEKYAVQDLTRAEYELLMEGLVVLKTEKFIDHESFVHERKLAVQMYQLMDNELVKTTG